MSHVVACWRGGELWLVTEVAALKLLPVLRRKSETCSVSSVLAPSWMVLDDGGAPPGLPAGVDVEGGFPQVEPREPLMSGGFGGAGKSGLEVGSDIFSLKLLK